MSIELGLLDSQEVIEIASQARISPAQVRIVLAELAELHAVDVVRMCTTARRDIEREKERLRRYQDRRAKYLTKKDARR